MNTFTGQDHERDRSVEVVLDVDPDVVRKGIRNLMQQVAQIERERVSDYEIPSHHLTSFKYNFQYRMN